MVDTLDLGSSAARCESSSLSFRTNLSDRDKHAYPVFFFFAWKKVDLPASPLLFFVRGSEDREQVVNG